MLFLIVNWSRGNFWKAVAGEFLEGSGSVQIGAAATRLAVAAAPCKECHIHLLHFISLLFMSFQSSLTISMLFLFSARHSIHHQHDHPPTTDFCSLSKPLMTLLFCVP
jgi:hypothetical protein